MASSEPLEIIHLGHKNKESEHTEITYLQPGSISITLVHIKEKSFYLETSNQEAGYIFTNFEVKFDAFQTMLKNSNYVFSTSEKTKFVIGRDRAKVLASTKMLLFCLQQYKFQSNFESSIYACENFIKHLERLKKAKEAAALKACA